MENLKEGDYVGYKVFDLMTKESIGYSWQIISSSYIYNIKGEKIKILFLHDEGGSKVGINRNGFIPCNMEFLSLPMSSNNHRQIQWYKLTEKEALTPPYYIQT